MQQLIRKMSISVYQPLFVYLFVYFCVTQMLDTSSLPSQKAPRVCNHSYQFPEEINREGVATAFPLSLSCHWWPFIFHGGGSATSGIVCPTNNEIIWLISRRNPFSDESLKLPNAPRRMMKPGCVRMPPSC